MNILAIDTSCDETSAAVTEGTKVLSNVVWSQAMQHAEFGGVMPSLAQRMHKEHIDLVVNKALLNAHCLMLNIEAVAVTAGPGLAIALEVGINKAKELASKLNIPLIPINHIEGHLLSPMAKGNSKFEIRNLKSEVNFPIVGLVVSGKHTELIRVTKIGEYKILAATHDDALGEAFDKAARMLGLGYPGGAIFEKMAEKGDFKKYVLPLPMARSTEHGFSYSGIKTAFYRLINANPTSPEASLGAQQICDLAASFQSRALQHLLREVERVLDEEKPTELWLGGGVGANKELRKRLRRVTKDRGIIFRVPYSAKLYGDNAAMVGVTAGLRYTGAEVQRFRGFSEVDRRPRWPIDQDFSRG